ncbi:hypothetical protein D9M69_700300 [compost metagenome]
MAHVLGAPVAHGRAFGLGAGVGKGLGVAQGMFGLAVACGVASGTVGARGAGHGLAGIEPAAQGGWAARAGGAAAEFPQGRRAEFGRARKAKALVQGHGAAHLRVLVVVLLLQRLGA